MSEKLSSPPRSPDEVHRLLDSRSVYEPGGSGGMEYDWWSLYGSLKLDLIRDAVALTEQGEKLTPSELSSLQVCISSCREEIGYDSTQGHNFWPAEAMDELTALEERLKVVTEET